LGNLDVVKAVLYLTKRDKINTIVEIKVKYKEFLYFYENASLVRLQTRIKITHLISIRIIGAL
tara:strand:+ start:1411 stop:1599 length:189 start_codon:yes stop_codon:yes gene_type:complete